MTNRVRSVVHAVTVALLAAAVLMQPRGAHAGECPPRIHMNPAPNEVCGREHYDSAAAAQRCAYADAIARMTPDERDHCGIGEKHDAPNRSSDGAPNGRGA